MKSTAQILGKMAYSEQLASEQWRKFSKSIREQRNFCECCRRSGLVLQVHHLFYEADRMLWEYESGEVVVLCESCHKALHKQLKQFREIVFRHMTPRIFQIVNGSLLIGLTQYEPLEYAHALAEFTANERLVKNHANAFNLEEAANAS